MLFCPRSGLLPHIMSKIWFLKLRGRYFESSFIIVYGITIVNVCLTMNMQNRIDYVNNKKNKNHKNENDNNYYYSALYY